jgi:hypothetical protein
MSRTSIAVTLEIGASPQALTNMTRAPEPEDVANKTVSRRLLSIVANAVPSSCERRVPENLVRARFSKNIVAIVLPEQNIHALSAHEGAGISARQRLVPLRR